MLLLFTKMSDWYRVHRKDIEKKGGFRLFGEYASLADALVKIYPDYQWDPSKFKLRSPVGFWQDKDNLFMAIDVMERKLGISKVPLLLWVL